MEDIPEKEIYFIFCQKGTKTTVINLETNSIVKSFKKLEEKKLPDNNIYILYHLQLSSKYKEKSFNLTLVDENAECYVSYIYSKKDEKFKYSLSFQPIYDNNNHNLNQVPLPYKTQFDIFYYYLKENKDNDSSYINSLFLDTIEYLSKNKDIGLDQKTLLFLFLEINKINPKDKEIDKKKIFEDFFKKINFVKLFEHCLINKKNINQEITLDELKVLKNIRNELVTSTGNKEDINENIDLFIMFYMIYINPEYFFEVLFENEGKNYDKIKSHLLANKKLFKNFTSEILSSEFFSDAPTLESIILVIKGFVPNMLEVLKLFSLEFFYMKFSAMLQMKPKYATINILDLCQPQKTDETGEFFEYYEKIFDNYRNEGFLPIKFDENFFLTYCNLFNYEDYKKIESIYKLVQFHNKNVRKNYKIKIEEKIINYYHTTGINLIEKKQLFNYQMFEFLNNDEFLVQDEKEKENKLKSMLNIITLGIHFDKKETKFINDLLNNKMIDDDFNIKSFFGNLYGIFVKNIFKKLTTPEELLNLGDCEIRFDSPDEILENLILLIERIWIAHPIKFPENIQDLISQAISYSSIKIPNIHLKVYQSLENSISKDILMPLYCLILIKQYDISEEYRGHIIYYIKMNCGNNALSAWYLLNTIDIDDEYERVEFLKKNLKDEFIVKVEDFIGFLNKKNENILLFQNLRIRKCFNLLEGALIETPYYKNSLKSKNDIFNLKYKDAIYIYKNIYQFRDLFMYFTPIEESREQQEISIEILLISFYETIDPKKSYFDSLEKILNFWEQFFSNDKKEDINKIKGVITSLENSSLNEFERIQNENLIYTDKFMKEAEEGERLKDSLFFMEIYNHSKIKIKNNEHDIYNNAIKLFSNLKKLGIDNNLNSLDNDLKDIIIDSIQNNRERLNNELNFIKNYFFKNKNENDNKYNNFNISKLKREILKLVKNAEKEFINLDDDLQEKVENFDENDIINNEAYKKFDSKKLIMEEKNLLIENISKLGHDYLLLSKSIKESSDKENSLTGSFKKFFIELFKINFGFAKLESDSEFTEKIIVLCKKIYMNNVEINLSKDDGSLIFISEFFDILETFEQNGKTSKKIMFLLLQKINELKNKYDFTEIVNSLIDLFSFISENVKNINGEENLTKLLIKLLIKEVKKKQDIKFYTELLKKLIFSRNISYSYQFLFSDLSPVMEEILGNEFNKTLTFNRNIRRNDILVPFENWDYLSSFQVIKDNIQNIDFKEMLLFYFETKIMNILDTSFNENEDFSLDNTKYYYLEYFLDYLERNNSSNRDELIKLFAIAYIKCYYSKIINILCNNNNELSKKFFESLYEGNSNEFKISMMLYVLKLVYENIGNVNGLEVGNGYIQSTFHGIIQKIKDVGYWDFEKVLKNKNSGFDFIIFPNKDIDIFFKELNEILETKKNCLDQINYDEKFIKTINEFNDIDSLYCVLLNTVFSLIYQNYSHEDNKKIIKWLNEIINKNEIQILKSNQILTKIFQFLINEKSYVEKIAFRINRERLSYQQLLCILISFRYVLKIIELNNKEGLFYNCIINEPKDILEKNKEFFNLYLNESNKDQREINYLTYKIIKYIIYSFLCVNYLLEKISLEEAYQIIGHYPKEDEGNYLFINLFKEFDFIQNDLLKILGIRNIIIFMNIIFDDVSNIINTIKINITENEIKEIENKLEENIQDKISYENLSISIKEYFSVIDKYNDENKFENITNPQKFYNILIENESYYNSKDEKNKLPFINYLTYTNFSCYDDFKKQYLYFKNDQKNYPMIDCILKENKILKIVEFIPALNRFIIDIYNKLIMNITREEANQTIKNKYPDTRFNEFNISLNNFLCIYSGDVSDIEINENSKIFEVINLEGNKINKIYSWIINEYNNFLEALNIYDENKKYIKEVIIQNCTENDYITFKSYGKSIQERLKEIILFYSKRNRINEKQELNVYNGGKIEYNFDLIENMLQNEFILCKRKFSKNQKMFIFSNEIFSKRGKIFEEFIKKYNQIGIIDKDINNNIEIYLNSKSKLLRAIYYDCLHLIIYLMIYLKDEKLNLQKVDIIYLIKLMEKENNKINDEFKNLFIDLKLNINQIYALYEIIEEKAFEYLIEKIKDETKEYETEKENDLFKKLIDNNIILKEDLLVKSIKKYIIRYCLGDNNGKDPILKKVKFEDIFNKIDIWGEAIFNDEKFKDESRALISEYQKDNNLLIYFYEIIFQKTDYPGQGSDPGEDNPEEDDDI